MAHRQATWRLRGAWATHLALRAGHLPMARSLDGRPHGHLHDYYQLLRCSVSRCANPHITVLVRSHRRDPFRP
jgi:hypothetical protein